MHYYIILSILIQCYVVDSVIVPTPNSLDGVGSQTTIFVAFDWRYKTLNNFVVILKQFASAFNRQTKLQKNIFYFGDLTTKIDCNLNTNLIDCVDRQILFDTNITMAAFNVTFYVC